MDYSPVFVILLGLGTVFFGLICLILLTTLMGRIMEGKGQDKGGADAAASVAAPTGSGSTGKTAGPTLQAGTALAAASAAKASTKTVAKATDMSAPQTGVLVDGGLVAAVSAAIAEQLSVDVSGIRILSFRKL